MKKPIYDEIGIHYSASRQTDDRIAAEIHSKLSGAGRILNIGAGSGSYEPEGVDLIAVEPSSEMIAQRSTSAHPVVQASAESLPFEENAFSHVMTVLSMHHWKDRVQAYSEINRVATEKFVALTWDPDAKPFWLTRDYFPDIMEVDRKIFARKDEFNEYFDNVEITPLLIPEDCKDGFLAAFWKRPQAYLRENIRQSMSSFAKMANTSTGLQQLERDLKNGTWKVKNKDILDRDTLDAGYILISANTR